MFVAIKGWWEILCGTDRSTISIKDEINAIVVTNNSQSVLVKKSLLQAQGWPAFRVEVRKAHSIFAN
jgi:hypothetical protein